MTDTKAYPLHGMNAVFHERFLNKNDKLNTIYPVNIKKKRNECDCFTHFSVSKQCANFLNHSYKIVLVRHLPVGL